MKVDIKKLPKSEIELTITVPYSVYRKWEEKAINELSQKIKIAGFRPGNIPEDIVREKVGKEALEGHTLDFVLPQTYSEAVKKSDLQVVAKPRVDIKTHVEKEGDEFVYTATVAVMPEIKLGNYQKIKVARKPVTVDKKKVEETIEMIMARFTEWNDVDRAAKADDRVEVSFEGFDEKGEAIPNTGSKNHPLVLGSKVMVPGFEEALIGMKKGDEKEFEVTFPKDYHAKPMQGKKVKFKASLERLEEKKDQQLNEEMVEKVTGKKQSIDEFRKMVEEDLKRELEMQNRQEHDSAVVGEIIKIAKADLPEAIIEQELEVMKEDQKKKVQQQGLNWEQYLQHIKKTEEDFTKDHRKGAEERILARLGVQKIIREAKLEVSEEETDKKVDEVIATYPEEQQKKAREHYKKGEPGYRNLQYNMAADKLIEMLSK